MTLKKSSKFSKPTTEDELNDLTIQGNHYWKSKRSDYSEIDNAEDFDNKIVKPVVEISITRRVELIKVMVSLQMFNESWSDSENQYRLPFIECLLYNGLNIKLIEEKFNLSFIKSTPSDQQLAHMIKESEKSSDTLFLLILKSDKYKFKDFCLKKAQLLLAEKGICPFGYCSTDFNEEKNFKLFNDNDLMSIQKAVKELESFIDFNIPESYSCFKSENNPDPTQGYSRTFPPNLKSRAASKERKQIRRSTDNPFNMDNEMVKAIVSDLEAPYGLSSKSMKERLLDDSEPNTLHIISSGRGKCVSRGGHL